MRATIKDVSAAAGVSIKTVSRVLNNERYVGAQTRERVQAAVAALNFRPSMAARSLAGRRSFQIALVCDNPSPHYLFEIQAGVRERCEPEGVRMIAQPYDRASPRLIDDILALVDTTQVDGVILTPPITDRDDVRATLRQRGVRTVLVSPGDVGATPSARIDNTRAAAVMTHHLLALGHRRIGFVAGHPDYAASAQRAAGHRIALAAAGIADDPALFAEGAYDFPSGARAGGVLLELPEPPTAIFAASDEMAAGVLTAAHARGLRLPDDLSVVGFGDDALAGYVWPPLTTIRQPTRDLGWQAADLLLTQVDERREIAFELVERGSTVGIGI
ncbi:LacI family DNA-binding transcriptional regulator [Sphingomonas sp.]|uniref:LacI family DNA-binding transcriptional regulator n=1 Tax=Sphingomonas sp. TaxID=28214 RepID=UPI002ED7B37C